MAFPNYIRPKEAEIITKIIEKALGLSYFISVNDGLNWALKQSIDFEAITSEVAATDVTILRFRTSEREEIGNILLIHGNDEDVVSDCTDTPRILELCS